MLILKKDKQNSISNLSSVCQYPVSSHGLCL